MILIQVLILGQEVSALVWRDSLMGDFHATIAKASRSLQSNENKEFVRMQNGAVRWTAMVFTFHYKKEIKVFYFVWNFCLFVFDTWSLHSSDYLKVSM